MNSNSAKTFDKLDEKCPGFKENVREYLMNTTLHGLRYVATKTITIFERTFFALAFLLVFTMATYFITNVWQKWNDSPIIIGLNPVAVEAKDTPFPALTICNMNQVRKEYAHRISEINRSILENVCANELQLNESSSEQQVEGTWAVMKKFLMESAQPCEEMLQMCRFSAMIVNCDEIFHSVLTDDGLCCTFNALHPKILFKNYDSDDHFESSDNGIDEITSWTPENGYQGTMYPNPVPGPGNQMGLTLILNADVDDYYCSSTSSAGFKFLLHSPMELPRMKNFGSVIATGQETRVIIKPAITDASESIRKIPISKRQCIFESESNLTYFKIYSRKNCEMECESMMVEEECGCVLYYMPRRPESKICNRKKALCYDRVLYSIGSTSNPNVSCICLPSCFEINYSKEMSSSKLGSGSFQTAENIFTHNSPESVQKNIAIVHIYLQEKVFRSFTKGELIGFTEFLSNTGGLLGLFMGFSVISLIELIYFLSIRPYCALRKTKKAKTREDVENSVLLGNNKFHARGLVPTSKSIGHYHSKFSLSEGFRQPPPRTSWAFIKTNLMWRKIKESFRMSDQVANARPYPYYN